MTLILALAAVVGSLGGHHGDVRGTVRGTEVVLEVDGDVLCRGQLHYVTDTVGSSELLCSDGRQGRITFNLVDGVGTAAGHLGYETLSLAIG